jgi:hypothetical protein
VTGGPGSSGAYSQVSVFPPLGPYPQLSGEEFFPFGSVPQLTGTGVGSFSQPTEAELFNPSVAEIVPQPTKEFLSPYISQEKLELKSYCRSKRKFTTHTECSI